MQDLTPVGSRADTAGDLRIGRRGGFFTLGGLLAVLLSCALILAFAQRSESDDSSGTLSSVERAEWTALGIPLKGRVVLPEGMLVGHVRDAETGKGIQGAAISTEPVADGAEVYLMGLATVDDGRYWNTAIAAAGTYEITAKADGYRPETRTVEVMRHEMRKADFELVPVQ